MKTIQLKNLSVAERFDQLHQEYRQLKKMWEYACENGGNVIELFDAMFERKNILSQLKRSFAPQLELRVSKKSFSEDGLNKIELTSFGILEDEVILFDSVVQPSFIESDRVPCVSCGDLIFPVNNTCNTCSTV